jgi:hypothetical protein
MGEMTEAAHRPQHGEQALSLPSAALRFRGGCSHRSIFRMVTDAPLAEGVSVSV